MNCDQFSDRLTAFNLGELPPADAAEARAHLQTCAQCTTLALRDRHLVSILRSSAVPAPAGVHRAVRETVRGVRPLRRHRWYRSPRLLAATVAAVLSLGALAAMLIVREAPPAEPPALLAAWDAYHADTLPLERHDAPGGQRPQDLSAAGLRAVESGRLTLAGTPASATEYRGDGGQRLVVFVWHGDLPEGTGEDGRYPGVEISTWDSNRYAWWERDGSVYCTVGNLDENAFMTAVGSVRWGA